MRRIFIAGPITHGVLADNINAATTAFVALAKLGCAPYCPHWSCFSRPCRSAVVVHNGTPMLTPSDSHALCHGTANGHDSMSYDEWLRITLAFVGACDAVFRLPGLSPGADAECSRASELGVPVFTDHADVAAWLKS